jgi:hypothetical protein
VEQTHCAGKVSCAKRGPVSQRESQKVAMIDDKAWLEFSYPLENDWKGKSESERAEALELVCIRRLETIWWPR